MFQVPFRRIVTSLALSFVLVFSAAATISCKKEEIQPISKPAPSSAVSDIFPKVTTSSTEKTSAAKNTSEEIKTKQNEKIFSHLVYNYYNESVGREFKTCNLESPYKCKNFEGTITKNNAETIIRYSLVNFYTQNELEKYVVVTDGVRTLNFSKDFIEKTIRKNIDCQSFNPTLFSSYNAETCKFSIEASDSGGSGELFGTPVISNITKSDEIITVKVNFYAYVVNKDGTMPQNEFGLGKADLTKKYQSATFTYKKSGTNYLLLKVETL